MIAAASLDPAETARFAALARDWWAPNGPMRPLHRMNPLRVAWIRDLALAHLPEAAGATDGMTKTPLAGLSALDIGCGGGLLSESLARLGADVVGIDPAEGMAAMARSHAEASGLAIDYRADTVETLAAEPKRFDMVFAMEVVEHVRDMPAFVATACGLVRPGGLFFASTLNRTMKSFALAIVGAEYVLRWLPRGTHRWEQFVAPRELSGAMDDAGVEEIARTGVVYTPIGDRWRTAGDTDVNYMMAGRKAG